MHTSYPETWPEKREKGARPFLFTTHYSLPTRCPFHFRLVVAVCVHATRRQFIVANPGCRAKYEQRGEHRSRPGRRLYTAVREVPVRVFLISCRGGLGLGKFSERKPRRRSLVSDAQRFGVFSQRGNLQCFPGHSRPRWSSGLALAAALFFGDELFHSSGDFVVLEDFPAVDLRQAFFHLADKPLVVTNQTLDRFMDQRGTIAPLLGRNAVQLGLQFGGKFYFHGVSVRGGSGSVKVFASCR